MAGYSKTPLVKKLGYKSGMRVYLVSPPKNYSQLLGDIPEGIVFQRQPAEELDLVHIFAIDRAECSRHVSSLAPLLTPSGMAWLSWPKKTSPRAGDISDVQVRAIGLAAGLVDVKVCAVDEDWSALKFVRRLKDR
jgi:hypothetical protein